MSIRKSLALGFIAVLLVAISSFATTQSAQGQCLPGISCPPTGGGGGGGGERKKRPTVTPVPTQTLAPTATLLPEAVLPALQPPALSGSNPSGPSNPGNPAPLGPVGPGPLFLSPWLTLGIIIVALVGLLLVGLRMVRRRGLPGGPALGTLEELKYAFMGDAFKKERGLDRAGGMEMNTTGGTQNNTFTRQDLGGGMEMNGIGGTQNVTITRQDLGDLGNGNLSGNDIGKINGGTS